MIVTLGLARLQVIFVLNHFSRLGNQMFPIKLTKVGVILNSWEMWQAGFSLAASPLASRGGPVASKVPREEESRQLPRLLDHYLIWPHFYHHREHYGYTTTLKHSENPFSRADAKGVHVTWMLASFTKFLNLVSFTGPIPPKIVQRDDSVTFKVRSN